MTLAPKWVNTEADEGALPALLQRLATLLPPDTIDDLWIFPTRRAASAESTVFVVSTFTDDAQRRHVFTAHFTVLRDRKGRATVNQQLHEHALAPSESLERVVDGVVRRLRDDGAHPPRAEHIAGNNDTWQRLFHELGGTPAAPAQEVLPESTSSLPNQADPRT
jgi:hypothetical protein